MSPAHTRLRLIRLLQGACSGELAAGYAYRGHAASLQPGADRDRIRRIEAEEWHHREVVIEMLRDLGAKPSPLREAIFWCIGRTIGLFCHIGGWFIPMYGAGRLERSNIVEYEHAAVYAIACDREDMVDALLTMAEVEWDHEQFFRSRIEGHPLLRLFPLWPAPPPRDAMRANLCGEVRESEAGEAVTEML